MCETLFKKKYTFWKHEMHYMTERVIPHSTEAITLIYDANNLTARAGE